MKVKYALPITVLTALAIAVIPAIIGTSLIVWTSLFLVVVCPLVAGALWLMDKDTEKKITDVIKEKFKR